ncbi:MAG TPA: vitamin K epoxide reductase family protein [Gemmatimonadales bacterium]|nr:vitamin K epoxide reductase family protein [Gemmatimonadales bacterium]
MIYRMSAVLLSLAGLFISAYLYLYKLGKVGSLACGTGGCETVQWSPWSRVAGIEVSLVGLLGYAGLLVLGLASLQPALAERKRPAELLALLAGIGVLFTLYLTYLELFVIHAICRWCVASGVVILAIFVVSLFDLRRLARMRNS